jgi:hypothetical protein
MHFAPPAILMGSEWTTPNALEEFVKAEIEAIVEAPENGCVALIPAPGSVEVKHLLHGIGTF